MIEAGLPADQGAFSGRNLRFQTSLARFFIATPGSGPALPDTARFDVIMRAGGDLAVLLTALPIVPSSRRRSGWWRR